MRRLRKNRFWGLDPACLRAPRRPVAQADPLALIGPRPGPADIWDATCGAFAARLPARRADDELGPSAEVSPPF